MKDLGRINDFSKWRGNSSDKKHSTKLTWAKSAARIMVVIPFISEYLYTTTSVHKTESYAP